MEEEPQSGEREGETWAEDDGAGSSLGARQANPGYGTAAGANAPPCELAELSGVQIPVRTATGGGKPGEWTMVELQGTVETGSAPLAGIAIGDLTILSGVRAPRAPELWARARPDVSPSPARWWRTWHARFPACDAGQGHAEDRPADTRRLDGLSQKPAGRAHQGGGSPALRHPARAGPAAARSRA